jgi:hypothetical protein
MKAGRVWINDMDSMPICRFENGGGGHQGGN